MESPLLRSSVAAAQLALSVRPAGTKQETTPVKSETASVKSELGTSPPSSVAWFVFQIFFTSRFILIHLKNRLVYHTMVDRSTGPRSLDPKQVKSEAPAVKKRKTEWSAAMKKMEGDTALVKDKGSNWKNWRKHMFVLRFLYLLKNARPMWWLMYAGHLGLPRNVCRGYLSRWEWICRFSTPSSGRGGCFPYWRARSDKLLKD